VLNFLPSFSIFGHFWKLGIRGLFSCTLASCLFRSCVSGIALNLEKELSFAYYFAHNTFSYSQNFLCL
jgi:hypothetical protein